MTQRPGWVIALLFTTAFVLLQWGWNSARGTWIERAVVHEATVLPAAWLINTVTPRAQARADGATLRATGGGLNVLHGCEGVEIACLLLAAIVSFPMTWKQRLTGACAGLCLVFVLNQARIMALFYAFRERREWFDALHSLVLPALLVTIVAAAFHGFIRRTA